MLIAQGTEVLFFRQYEMYKADFWIYIVAVLFMINESSFILLCIAIRQKELLEDPYYHSRWAKG